MPPPIRPRPRNAMRGELMAGKFPDAHAERYNKRAKNSGGKFGGVEMETRLWVWGLAGPPTAAVCRCGNERETAQRAARPPTSRGLPMTAHCGHAC